MIGTDQVNGRVAPVRVGEKVQVLILRTWIFRRARARVGEKG
jgi:hypothetical protein